MISWTRLLKLHPQLFCNLFSSSNLSKKRPKTSSKPPFLEGLETRLTPANPTVLSILRNSGTLVSTTASYAVSFSESVSGVDSSDFTCITTGGASFNSLSVSGSGSAYTVTISGISGNGTIALKLVDNDSIVNSASQPLEAQTHLEFLFPLKLITQRAELQSTPLGLIQSLRDWSTRMDLLISSPPIGLITKPALF